MSIRAYRDLRYRASRNKTVKRPKTFKSEEAAHAYAKENKIVGYTLKNLRADNAEVPKLRIIQKTE